MLQVLKLLWLPQRINFDVLKQQFYLNFFTYIHFKTIYINIYVCSLGFYISINFATNIHTYLHIYKYINRVACVRNPYRTRTEIRKISLFSSTSSSSSSSIRTLQLICRKTNVIFCFNFQLSQRECPQHERAQRGNVRNDEYP